MPLMQESEANARCVNLDRCRRAAPTLLEHCRTIQSNNQEPTGCSTRSGVWWGLSCRQWPDGWYIYRRSLDREHGPHADLVLVIPHIRLVYALAGITRHRDWLAMAETRPLTTTHTRLINIIHPRVENREEPGIQFLYTSELTWQNNQHWVAVSTPGLPEPPAPTPMPNVQFLYSPPIDPRITAEPHMKEAKLKPIKDT